MPQMISTRPAEPTTARLRTLYPYNAEVELEGLFLDRDLRRQIRSGSCFLYANFITSLDGRVAVPSGDKGQQKVPEALANPRDWRLLSELAAPADALLVSDRYVRELAAGKTQTRLPLEADTAEDIREYRHFLGLPPRPDLVVVSERLDLPLEAVLTSDRRRVLVLTGAVQAHSEPGWRPSPQVEVITAGDRWVEGRRLAAALADRGLQLVYSLAGPAVLHTLLEAGVLRRLYLTTVLRMLGGRKSASLAQGQGLLEPYDFRLRALYLDPQGPGGIEQLLQIFDHSGENP